VRVRIVAAVANSILQGGLLIDEAAFAQHFPTEVGYRMFLIDAPFQAIDRVAATLGRALADVGLELTPTIRRLSQFNAVQNTYLSTFQVLGGLGLVLGSVGLGVVLMRNVFERRGELALLLAVGYRPTEVRSMVLSEHGLLLLSGLAVGLAAAAVAVVPSVRSSELPYLSLGLTLAAVLASGMFWTWGASRWSLRGDLLPALRRE
jgi:ABC-type antimicrobial peptide transport system permease subunit